MTSETPNPAVPPAPSERQDIQDELWQAISDAVDYDTGPSTWAKACVPLVERWREQWIADAELRGAEAMRSAMKDALFDDWDVNGRAACDAISVPAQSPAPQPHGWRDIATVPPTAQFIGLDEDNDRMLAFSHDGKTYWAHCIIAKDAECEFTHWQPPPPPPSAPDSPDVG